MTLPQIMHALGVDADRDASAARAADETAKKRREILRRIIDQNGWVASRLLDIAPVELARLIQAETGGEIDVESLGRWAEQYVNDIRRRDLS
jgi:hypothetical protein